MNKLVEKTMTKKAIEAVVANVELSKSAKMRTLFDGGVDIKTIAGLMEVRYNFVFNVVDKYLLQSKAAGTNVEVLKNTKRSNVKEEIVSMLRMEVKVREISQVLNVSDNYIYKLKKEMGL